MDQRRKHKTWNHNSIKENTGTYGSWAPGYQNLEEEIFTPLLRGRKDFTVRIRCLWASLQINRVLLSLSAEQKPSSKVKDECLLFNGNTVSTRAHTLSASPWVKPVNPGSGGSHYCYGCGQRSQAIWRLSSAVSLLTHQRPESAEGLHNNKEKTSQVGQRPI